MSAADASLAAFQQQFTAHLRSPQAVARPAGVPARRMKVYHELVYNNVESFLLACYPVLHAMLGKRRWAALVRGFFVGHRCHSPIFRQIPDEFLQYLQASVTAGVALPAYALELAHYEWIELALSVSNRDDVLPEHDPHGDLLDGVPLLNPVLANLAYSWPVQQIRPRRKVVPTPTWLLVFRDAAGGVRFMQINPFTARLLTLLESGELSARAALARVAEESRHPDPAVVETGGLAVLENLRQEGALLGVRRPA